MRHPDRSQLAPLINLFGARKGRTNSVLCRVLTDGSGQAGVNVVHLNNADGDALLADDAEGFEPVAASYQQQSRSTTVSGDIQGRSP